MQRQRSHVNVHYVASTTFTLDSGYSDLKPIGRGSYGVVCSAFSAKHDSKVAIKKITPVSANTMDIKHVLREIKLMRHMGKHENVITLLDLILREANDELYIVMELMDSDLHRIIQSKQQLTDGHFKHFFFQLMCGVKYLHDNKIIHRDLKPGNLLVGKDCRLRITDFGLAREKPDNIEDGPMTEHVVTRWYRSPELMLCPDGIYSYPVDIWSCGCILAEMLGRNPLFPGKTFIHQLSLIFDVIGSPAPGDVKHIVNAEALAFLQSQRGKRKVAFSTIYPKAESSAWRILEDTLAFVPSRRPTADDILRSPYLHGTGTAASLEFPPVSSDFSFPFENAELSKQELKQLLFNEIMSFRRERSGRTDVRKEEVTAHSAPSDRHTTSTSTSSRADAVEDAAQRERRRKSTGSSTRAGLKARRAEAKDDAPQPPAASAAAPGPADANIPRYLRPTGNIRDRYASAPRPRPTALVDAAGAVGAGEDRAAGKRGGASTVHRAEDKDQDDMASVNSGSVVPRSRPVITTDFALKPTVVMDARQSPDRGDAKVVGDGDETPRVSAEFLLGTMTARPITATGSRNTTQPRINPTSPERQPNASRIGADNEIRASTMRNLISMCDELYREDGRGKGSHASAAAPVSEAKEEPRPEQQYLRRYSDHKNATDNPLLSSAVASEYKAEEAGDLFSPKAKARAPPPARMATQRQQYSEEKGSPVSYAHRGPRAAAVTSTTPAGAKDQDDDSDEEVARSAPAPAAAPAPMRAAVPTAAEPKEAWARPVKATYKTVSYDSDPEPALEARDEHTPVSPTRKSLLQTYTSPTRLKSTRPGGSPLQRSPGLVGAGHFNDRSSDPAVLSLAERLQERARLLSSTYTSTLADDADRYSSSHAHPNKPDDTSGGAVHGRDDNTLEKLAPSENREYDATNQRQGRESTGGGDGIRASSADGGSDDGNEEPPTQPAARPRKFTVAKSPKFSLMSWQKKREEQREEQREAEARQAAQLLEESKQRRKSGSGGGGGLGKTAKSGATGNYFGYEAPKRSESAPRHRR